MHEAAYYHSISNNSLICDLCPHHCRLRPQRHGICLTRQNIDGRLISQNYCRIVSTAIDPIEKKPLYHFYPGSSIYSTGPNGCTFKCEFCQNCEIAQQIVPASLMSVAGLVSAVQQSGSIGIAYTYSEPTIWYETIMDVGIKIKNLGLCNVMVTNGFIETKPLEDLLNVIDAFNIDIKSMRPEFYKKICKGRVAPVLRACEMAKKKAHVEITNLIIPGLNDTEEDIKNLALYIKDNLGADTPLHLSRYFPRHKMTIPATPLSTLERFWKIARDILDFVYVGNCIILGTSSTLCPECSTELINRENYKISIAPGLMHSMAKSRSQISCPRCNKHIAIRFV